MEIIDFRDPVGQEMCNAFIQQLDENKHQAVKQACDKERFSDSAGDRLNSAIGYAVLADYHRRDNQFDKASQLFHFAGHGFRLLGMTAKAALVYEHSFVAGEKSIKQLNEPTSIKSQYNFNLRSLGRAIHCYIDSGQFDKATQTKRLFHSAELAHAKRSKKWGKYSTLLLWQNSLDYSLSWARPFAIFTLAAISGLFTPASIYITLLTIASTTIQLVGLRRLP